MDTNQSSHHVPWNKGKIVGQKAPFKLKEVWAIRMRLHLAGRIRELAMFDLGIDSKLRACDLMQLRVRDICHGDRIAARTIVMQQKTKRPVQFEITDQTKDAVAAWIKEKNLKSDDFLFPSPRHGRCGHLTTRQYARIVHSWVRRRASIHLRTQRTRCDEPRRATSIDVRRTFAQCSCSWGIPS